MKKRSGVRGALRWLVIGAGALATIATSAPQDPTVETREQFPLANEQVSYVVVHLDEATMDHLRAFDGIGSIGVNFSVAASLDGNNDGYPLGGVEVVSDDDAFEPQMGLSARFILGLDACPEEGACSLGFSVDPLFETTERTLSVRAYASVSGDPAFLFPQNRQFPEGASLTVELEQ